MMRFQQFVFVTIFSSFSTVEMKQSVLTYFLCFIPGERFKVETKTIAADFGDRESIYRDIEAGLKGLEVGVLGLFI